MSIREDELIDDLQEEIANLQRQLEEKTRMLAAYEAHPVVAWMLTGSNVYEDAAFANQKWADERLASRGAGDKAVKVPLIAKPSTTEHIDALIADAEKRGEKRGMERAAYLIENASELVQNSTFSGVAEAIRSESNQEEK